MRAANALATCMMLALAWGCAPAPRLGAQGDVAEPPGIDDAAGIAELLEEFRRDEPPPLSADAPAPVLTYEIPGGLQRPPQVAGRLDAKLRRSGWRHIVIHHSATDAGSEASFDRYHKRVKGWRGVGYHFVIGNGSGSRDGLVEVTFRWEKQLHGAHANNPEYNQHGIGICLVGNFERTHPTAKQMEALVGLVNYLQERCRIPVQNVVAHHHVRRGSTSCPGRNFPWFELISRLNH